ncbi:hypothetical protein N7481_004895 [Penicillium waksmanii]|uniref:uncharacterized protein n=1 Tax=Penicillium waksmanii TaxID=69791 RepID=UPI002548D72B|nr:uncharacterized protein N7481_004895 [Penicillium waksmanii]KAJ5989685.1 hypothetical protein N7481_004895 [Penicillium waksmanii]
MTVYSLFHSNINLDLLLNFLQQGPIDAIFWSEFARDLGPSALPSNLEINLPKPQPLETLYLTPQSAPSPDVGADIFGSDFSPLTNFDPF